MDTENTVTCVLRVPTVTTMNRLTVRPVEQTVDYKRITRIVDKKYSGATKGVVGINPTPQEMFFLKS